jgi:Tol biopolymer transport system component
MGIGSCFFQTDEQSIRSIPVDGNAVADVIGTVGPRAAELTLSRNGELAAFVGDFSYPQLWTLAPAEGGVPAPFYHSSNGEFNPAVSPDGRFIAFGSTVTNREEVFVRIHPGPGKWQISTEGGGTPLWSGDGTELYYRDGERLMIVDVRTN